MGLTLTESLSAANRIYVFRVLDPKNSNPLRICQSLLGNNLVAWAEPNIAQEGQALGYPPNDTLLGVEWYVHNTGQTGARSGADVKAYDAWTGGKYGSPGIRIAILDNGVDTSHADLAANIVAGYDFKDGDSDPRPANSFDNHGTAVAGTAAAVVDNTQVSRASQANAKSCQFGWPARWTPAARSNSRQTRLSSKPWLMLRTMLT